MNNIDKRIVAIELRNKKVELDKAWETSKTRRLSIASLTYLVVAGYLITIGNDQPLINAFVPVVGYLLSTLLLPKIKASWQSSRK